MIGTNIAASMVPMSNRPIVSSTLGDEVKGESEGEGEGASVTLDACFMSMVVERTNVRRAVRAQRYWYPKCFRASYCIITDPWK